MKTMRRVFCLGLGLMAVIPAGGIACAEIVQKYINMRDGFTIEVPRGWQIEEREKGPSPFIAFRPREKEDEIVFERVQVEVTDAPGRNLNVFYQKHVNKMEKSLAGFTIVSEGETKINDLPARWLVYTYTDKFITLKVQAKAMQYMVIKGDSAYLITCIATVKSYDEYQPTFRKIVNTFQLTGR